MSQYKCKDDISWLHPCNVVATVSIRCMNFFSPMETGTSLTADRITLKVFGALM